MVTPTEMPDGELAAPEEVEDGAVETVEETLPTPEPDPDDDPEPEVDA